MKDKSTAGLLKTVLRQDVSRKRYFALSATRIYGWASFFVSLEGGVLNFRSL